MKTLVTATAIALMSTSVLANEAATDVRVFDHVKTVTTNIPVTTTECQNVQVPIYGTVQQQGNAVEGAIGGAIIGGILGQALGGDKNSRNAGAVFGAIVGGDKASKPKTGQAIVGYKQERQCFDQVTYQNATQEVYSHSTIRFTVNGYRYVVNFQRSDR